MTPKEDTQKLNLEYAHHANLLGKKKAIGDIDKAASLREFDIKIYKVSFPV